MTYYKGLQPVHGFLCGKLPAECAETQWTSVIHHTKDVCGGTLETEMSRRSRIQMIIHSNVILAANKDCMHFSDNC